MSYDPKYTPAPDSSINPKDSETTPAFIVGEHKLPVEQDDTQIGVNALSSFFRRMKTPRQRSRFITKELNALSLYCSSLVNQWFKFVSLNKGEIDKQGAELERLNVLWKNHIRKNSKKYVYEECSGIFMIRIKFLIGTKKIKEERLIEIQAAGENNNPTEKSV